MSIDLTNIVAPPTWAASALCAQTDPELFFPEKGGSTREAKALCRRCPVRDDCLDYALAHDARFGIWGGTSERDRRRMKRPAGQPPADPRANEVRRLATRLTDAEVAARLGCSTRTVLRIRKAAGITPAGRAGAA